MPPERGLGGLRMYGNLSNGRREASGTLGYVVDSVSDDPSCDSKQLLLTPLSEGDLPFLYGLAVGPDTWTQWHCAGGIPSPSQFETTITKDVLCQLLITDRESGSRVGVAFAYDPDPLHRTCSVNVVMSAQHIDKTAGAMVHMIDYIFDVQNMHKVKWVGPEYRFGQLSREIGSTMEVEAIVPDEYYYNLRRWAAVHAALYRDNAERPVFNEKSKLSVESPPGIPFRGRWVRLEPINRAMLPWLYDLAVSGDGALRWRYGGSMPSRHQFESTFWDGVLIQLAVVENRTDVPMGLVVGYKHDFALQHAYIGAVMEDRWQRTGQAIEGVLLFFNLMFRMFDFHRLFMDVPEYNIPWIGGAAQSLLTEQGRLGKYRFWKGRWWDQIVVAGDRTDLRLIERYLPSEGGVRA